MEIKTKLGTIFAEVFENDDYPGIFLCLRSGDKKIGLVLLEVNQSDSENPELLAHVWHPDNIYGDPDYTLAANRRTVERMLEEA